MKKVYFDYGSGWEDVSKFIRDDLTITDRFANSSYHYAQNVANMTMLIGDVPEVPDGSTPYYYMDDWSEATANEWVQTLAETTLPTTRGGVYQRDFVTISGGIDYVLKLKCSSTGPSVIALVGERSDDEFELITTANMPGGESVVTFEFTSPDDYTGLGFIWDARVNVEWSWLYIGDGLWESNLDKLRAASEVKVLIQDIVDETTTQIFQGLIAEKPSYEYDGIFENIQIDLEATDRIRKLDVEMGDFVMRNAKIMDYTDKDNSIIHQLAYEAGLTDTYIADAQILVTLSGFSPSSEKSNILSEMDKLCFEHGYVLHMDEYDKIHPLPWIVASGVASHIFSETNVVGSISVSEGEREFEGIKITYNELGEKDNVLLYRDDLPYNSDGTFTGYVIPSGYYYPIEANVIDETTGTNQIVYQEYDDTSIKAMTNKAIVEKLDFDPRTAMNAFKSDYSAIVATSGHYLEYRIDGGLTPDTAVYNNKKAQVRFNNTTTSGVAIYYLNVKGSCLYRTADRYSEVVTISGSKKIDEYTTSYVFDKTTADTLAQFMAMEQAYGRFSYKFKSDDDVAVGSLVSIVNDARMNQDVVILDRTYDNKEDLYEYTCKGYDKDVSAVTGRSITRTPIKDSFDVVSVGLSSYNLNILSDINGENLQLDDATITCTVLVNGMDYTPDWTYTEVTTSGVLGSISSNVYTISGMTSDSGYVDIKFSKANYTDKTLRCNVSRLRQGVTTYVIQSIPTYAPIYKGRVAYGDLAGTSANTNDIILAYSTASGECGLYKNISGWQKQYPPTTEMVSEAWPDIIYCANNSYPNTGTAQEKIQAYTGPGLTYFEMLGANFAFLESVFAQKLKVGADGVFYGGDRFDDAGTVIDANKDGWWFGAGTDATFKIRGKELDFTFRDSSGNVVGHLGADNLLFDTTDNNASIGYEGIPIGATGDYNFAFGVKNLASLTTGEYNIAIGYAGLNENTAGSYNIALGYAALNKTTTGVHNVGIGFEAVYSNTVGTYNIGIGASSLRANGTGSHNIAVGFAALHKTTSDHNIAIGDQVLYENTTGTYNLGIGYLALHKNTTGVHNIGIGYVALTENVTGAYNVAVGYATLAKNLGDYNVAIGDQALYENTTGTKNVGVGYLVLHKNTVGYANVAIGYEGLFSNVEGIHNIAIGTSALYANLGSWNVAVGVEALGANTTGVYNTAIGYLSLATCTEGYNNTAIGRSALLQLTTGHSNTAVGVWAGINITTEANSTCLGYNAQVTGSNQVQLGNSSTTTYAYGAVQDRSDKRDKADIQDTKLGLNFIGKLRPVDFRWDYREDYKGIEKDGSKKRKRYHHGLIAQEVKAVIDELGIDFGGYQDHKLNGGKDVLSVGYTELIAPMIKAIQELSKEVEILKEKLGA